MKLKLATAALAALALATVAQAVPIFGNINITPNGTTAAIDFTNDTVTFSVAAPANNSSVDSSGGVLGFLLPAATPLAYQNFGYDPLIVTNPIWTGVSGGFTTSFALTNISFVQEIGTSALTLFGSGIISTDRPGFDPTPGEWSFSATRTGASSFSWNSTTSAFPVPDGGATLTLLGLGVLGLGGTRRFLASSKK